MKINPKTIEKYKDIIYLDHPTSLKHPRMSIENRAAQFAPFAALTGHKEKINETARLTEQKIDLTEDQKKILDRKFQILLNYVGTSQTFIFEIFVPDKKKTGGAYILKESTVKKVNLNQQLLFLEDGIEISLKDIFDIQSDVFKDCIS